VVVFQVGGFQDGFNIGHELRPLGSSSSSLEKVGDLFILTGERVLLQ
jgi:hypothetical protein